MIAASCDDLALLGMVCVGTGARLNKTATADSYNNNRAVTINPIQGIGLTTEAMADYWVRFGLSLSSTSSSPIFGAGLFPSGLRCTGWEGCNSYNSHLGGFGAADVVSILVDAAGAICLYHNTTLLKTTATGAVSSDMHGVITFYKAGVWVQAVHLEWLSPPQPPLPPISPPPPLPPSAPPLPPVPPGLPDSSPPLVRAMPRSALDHGRVELLARGTLAMPIEYPLNETVHREREMFGYAPRFMPNYVVFDASNRPWILANAPAAPFPTSAVCYVDGNCDGSRSASRGYVRVMLQTLDDLGRWKAIDVGETAASAGVQGLTTQRVMGGTFVDQSVHLADDGEVYAAVQLDGAGGKLMHASIEAPLPTWRFVDGFWAQLQLQSELHVPVGLQYASTSRQLSVTTGAHDTWTSTALHTASPGEILFWSDARSHAGGGAAAHVQRAPGGAGRMMYAFVVYATTKPAAEADIRSWHTWYNATSQQLARVNGGPSAMPGTANWALQYNFTSGALVGGAPIFVGITLSNTQPGYDYHNAPNLAVDHQGCIHLMLGSHGKPLVYRRSLEPWSLVGGLSEPELVFRQCNASSRYCGVETYPAWLVDDEGTVHCVARTTGRYRERGDDDAPYMMHYMRRNATTAVWEDRGPMVVPFTNQYHVYEQKLTIDHIGTLYLAYFFNDYSGVRIPCMLVSHDRGDTWALATTADFRAGLHANRPRPPTQPPSPPSPRMPPRPPWAPGGPEVIFGDYFDVRAAAAAGTYVSGRLNPRANRDAGRARNLTSWAFVLLDEGASSRFEVVNVRDTHGRLYGAVRVAAGSTAGAWNTTHVLAVELHDLLAGTVLGARQIHVHVVNETALELMAPRVQAFAAGDYHMYATKPSGDKLASQLSHIERHGGQLEGHDALYAWTPEEKRTGGTLQAAWEAAVKDLGGLGWAISAAVGSAPNATERLRLQSAILAALAALGQAAPIDVSDLYNETQYAALDIPFKEQHGEAFAGDLTIHPKRQTHQWDIADPIGLACVEVARAAASAALDGSKAAWAGLDGAVRLLTPVFTLNTKRRTIDDPEARWYELVDGKRSNGVWSDANLGHRLRLWACMMYLFQDYNRPITYVPYWYDDFDFRAFAKEPATVVPPSFSLVRSFPTAKGAMADVTALLHGAYHRATRIRQSGFLPDGFISHHCDKGNDAALKAYGFEWLQRPLQVAALFRGTPWMAALGADWMAMPVAYLTYTYNRVCFKGQIDWSFVGRAYSGQTLYRFWKSELRPTVAILLDEFASELAPEARQQLAVMHATKAGPEPAIHGNTAFWVSHAMVHRHHGWYMSVRFRSRRAHGNEDFDAVSKSWHCGSGVLKVLVHGDEYDQVRARMDWHVLPGVTEEWRNDTLPHLKDASLEGTGGNHFAASASDGQLGLAAFQYVHHELETSVYSSAASNKAYFFLPDGVVALGNSVRRVQTGQGHSIVTTIDQSRWRGPITLHSASLGIHEIIAFDGDPIAGRLPSGGCARLVAITPGHTLSLHHGHVGYVVSVPLGSLPLTLELRCGGEVRPTDAAMAEDSSWGDKRRWKNQTEYWGSDIVFLAVVHHGADPANGTYQYAVVPGTAFETAQQELAWFNQSHVRIVRNDDRVMALVDLRRSSAGDGGNVSVSAQVKGPRIASACLGFSPTLLRGLCCLPAAPAPSRRACSNASQGASAATHLHTAGCLS